MRFHSRGVVSLSDIFEQARSPNMLPFRDRHRIADSEGFSKLLSSLSSHDTNSSTPSLSLIIVATMAALEVRKDRVPREHRLAPVTAEKDKQTWRSRVAKHAMQGLLCLDDGDVPKEFVAARKAAQVPKREQDKERKK